MSSLTHQLVARLTAPIGALDRRRAALHLLDWLGCALYGTQSAQAISLRAYLQRYGPAGSCSVLGQGRAHWETAILYNAALGNIAEMDDLHRASVLHPGPVVIPAALAVAEQQGAGPEALLNAIVRGYEACIRIGRALGEDHYRFYHPTSTCGAFGAAAAAASLLKLDADQTVWALGNAGTRTGGLWQLRHEGVMSKQLHTAEAARSGVMAAMLAAEGFTGPAAILEGEHGLFAATSPLARSEKVASSEKEWLLHHCSFKPWAACRHTHPAIDAARLLRLQLRSWQDIEALEVGVYSDALTFCDQPEPQTELDAKFSIQHGVAVALLVDRPQLKHFQSDFIQQWELRALRSRVSVDLDAGVNSRYRQHWGATLTATLTDGGQREAAVTDAWGDPENPMSEADLVAKAGELLTAVSYSHAKPLCDAVLGLPDANDLGLLRSALAGTVVSHAVDTGLNQ